MVPLLHYEVVSGATTSRRGPGERHLDDLSARGALWVRTAITGLCGAFGLGAYHGSDALVAVAIGCVLVVLCGVQIGLRARLPVAAVVANAIFAAGIGGAQLLLGPQPFSGWIVATASVASITCFFEWPDRTVTALVLAGLTITAYAAGCVLTGGGLPMLPAGRMVVQALLGFLGLLAIHRVARMYDALNARLARRRSDVAATRVQHAAERAYLALLHDTASTTFLMISTGATRDVTWLPAQARRDLDALTTEWSPPPEMDLAELLATLTDYPGLDIRHDLHGPLTMPSEPALAVYHGVREALSNTRAHAGIRTATVTAREDGGRIEVRVRDRGRGFDQTLVPEHRHGLSESIVARMNAAGGRVEIDTAPGRGTSVKWWWARG